MNTNAMTTGRTFGSALRRVVLAAVAAALTVTGVLGLGAPSAQAAITLSGATCVRPNLVTPGVGVNANQSIVNGGQYVSVQFRFLSVATNQVSYSAWSNPVIAPRYGTTYIGGKTYVMKWNSIYKWTRVSARVAYWSGNAWSYSSWSQYIDNGVCLA